LSVDLIRQFLADLEEKRHCMAATRNQRLGGLHSLARFIGQNSPEHVEWCTQIRLIPFKRTVHPGITYLEKQEIDAIKTDALAVDIHGRPPVCKAFVSLWPRSGESCRHTSGLQSDKVASALME